jgi:hypothetical protein
MPKKRSLPGTEYTDILESAAILCLRIGALDVLCPRGFEVEVISK